MATRRGDPSGRPYGWGRGLPGRCHEAGLRPGVGEWACPRFFFIEFLPEASGAFTVHDLRDLVEPLRAHPQWREPLWALLASEEARRMPGVLAGLREATERGFRRATRLILALHRAQQRQARETDRRFAELR